MGFLRFQKCLKRPFVVVTFFFFFLNFAFMVFFKYFFCIFCFFGVPFRGIRRDLNCPLWLNFACVAGAWCFVKILMSTPDDMVLNHLNLKSVEVATPSLRH